MFGENIWLPKCQMTSSRCEDLIVTHFYLQMLDGINVKNSWNSLRCKHQLKQIIKTREKNVATNENCILRKMGLKFEDTNFNILCEITFWNKQKWLNKELSLFGGTTLENDKFHFQENFWLHWTKSTCIHHPQPARQACWPTSIKFQSRWASPSREIECCSRLTYI